MKKLVKILLVIVVAVIIVVTAVYAYYGGFRSIDLKVEETGGELFVYENMTGDYSQSPVYMDSVYYFLLNELNIATTKGVGIYYDHPEHVETSKLRSEVGCFLDSPVDSIQMVNILKKFKIKEVAKGQYLTTELPNKGMMSIMVGIIRVYPAMAKYMEENGHKDQKLTPIMEIYDQPTKTIIYRHQLD